MSRRTSLRIACRTLAVASTAVLLWACNNGGSLTLATTEQPVFTNSDFETDAIGAVPSSWTVETFLNKTKTPLAGNAHSDNLGLLAVPPNSIADLNLVSGGVAATVVVGVATGGAAESVADPDLGTAASFRYPKFGLRSVVVNSGASTGKNQNVNDMHQTMTLSSSDVDPIDNQIHLRFVAAAVLQNPSHNPWEQPYFYIQLNDITKGTNLYTNFNFAGQPGVPWLDGGNSIQYTDWELVDIAPGSAAAVGDSVEMIIYASGCSRGGHWGRVYVDAVQSAIPGLFVSGTGPATATSGNTIDYTLTYRNGGSTSVAGAEIDFVLPPNTTYASVNGNGLTCTAPSVGASTGTVRCVIGTLAANSHGSITVGVTIGSAFIGTLSAGDYWTQATNVSQLLGNRIDTIVTNEGPQPGAITIVSGSPQSAVVGHAFAAPLEILLKDTNGAVMSNVVVTYTVPTEDPTATLSASGTATTDSNGHASVNATAGPIVGEYNVTASVEGLNTQASFDLTNTPGPATAIVVVSGTPQSAIVDTEFADPLVAQVNDANGNPVPNVTVSFAAPTTGASATITGTFVTDDNGQVSVIATAKAVAGGPYNVNATISGVNTPATFALTNTAGNPAAIAVVSGTPQNTTVDTNFTSPLVAVVTDSLGNKVSNATVSYATPSSGASATVVASAVTASDGTVSVSAKANSVEGGPYNVTASLSGVVTPATFALTNNAGTGASIAVVSGTPQSAVVGNAFANPLVAVVTDSDGNKVPNATVTFTTPSSGASVTVVATANTDSNGKVSVTATANTIAGGPYNVSATIVGGNGPATFSLTNTNGAAATITMMSGSPQSTTINTDFAAPLVAAVTDADGNAVSGATVNFAVPSTGASATVVSSAQTDSNGQVSVSATANATAGGPYNVTAAVDGIATPATFALTNTTGAPAMVAVNSGTPQSAPILTQFANPLSVAVTDAGGNPVSGVIVTFTPPSTGASATFTSTATTDSNGNASTTATANGTAGGPYDVTATIAGVATPATFALTNTTGTPTMIAVESGTPQSAPVLTQFANPLVVSVTDAGGNPVSGVVVTFTPPSTGATATVTSTVMTDAGGNASVVATANGTAGGPYNVTATVAGVTTPATFALTNTTGPAMTITAVSGTPQSAQVLTAFANPLVAQVTDAGGNPVSGATVTFTPPTSGASATIATTAMTDSNGNVSLTATANGTVGGPYNVSATVDGATEPAEFALTNTLEPGTLNGGGGCDSSGGDHTLPVAGMFGALLLAMMLLRRRRLRRPGSAIVTALALLLLVGVTARRAHADPAPAVGAGIDLFHAAPAGSDWFSLDSLDFRGNMVPAARLLLDYGHDPLVVYNTDGSRQSVVVAHQLWLDAGASLNLYNRFRVGFEVPVAIYQGSDPSIFGGTSVQPSDSQGVGDISLSADARLYGRYRGLFSVAAGLTVGIPTGFASSYLGDHRVSVAPRVSIAGGYRMLQWAAQLSYVFRDGQIADIRFNDELRWAASVGARLAHDKLLIGPEFYGLIDIGASAGENRTAAAEGDLGAHYQIAPRWRVGLGVGTGIAKSAGVPDFRLLASLDWTGNHEQPRDRDGDGIIDSRDACPDVKGVPSKDPALNGCPILDRDHDGVVDADDLCPDVPQGDHPDPKKHGCPEGDRDKDGVLDDVDQCPDVPQGEHPDPKKPGCPDGDRDNDFVVDSLDQCPDEPAGDHPDPARPGCPLPDRDHDSIPDVVDACPDKPGQANPDPAKNGCPGLVDVKNSQIMTLAPVLFATDKDVILQTSYPVLQAVADVLKTATDVKRVSIEGHTDDRGKPAHNLDLSDRRAKSVMKWLIKHGIAADRLESHGFGQTKPEVPNDSDANRSKNRRVEFHITDGTATTSGTGS